MPYQNFIETIGFVDQGAPARFGHSLAVRDEFGGSSTVVPHAPYSVSPALFRLIAAQGMAKVYSMHNQETEAENEFLMTGGGDFLRLYAQLGLDVGFFKGTGSRSMQSSLRYFGPGHKMILVHNVATVEGDLRAAGVGGHHEAIGRATAAGGPELYFCLCPNANLYISGQLPDVPMLMRNGCRLVVGTDSLASNHGLSILAELKSLQQAFPELKLETMLQWATANGAEALGMDAMGTFSRGKKPGVILLQGLDAVRRVI
jgi:cytosine/adenosine deaminase-related metal-dependent hydrolase